MLRQSTTETLERPYVQSAIVYACINARARALTAIPIKYWTDESKETPVTDRAFLDLMRRPNPLLSARKFWRIQEIHYGLAGGSFWFMNGKDLQPVMPGELPTEIWPVREDLVKPIFDKGNKSGLPDAWAFNSATGAEVTYPDHAVAHLFDPDPHNPLRGVGPMQAAFRGANVSFKAEAFDDALTANGGRIGGVLQHESAMLDEKQRSQLEQSFHENHEKAVNHKKTAVLPAGLSFKPTAFSPLDMDFATMREWMRQQSMMVFGCTKPLLGITDDVNRANAEAARRVFYENTIVPQTSYYEDEFDRAFISDLRGPLSTVVMEFDLSAVPALRENIDSQVERILKLMGVGRSFAEAAAIVGLTIEEDIPGGEDRYISNTLTAIANEEKDDETTASPQASLNGAQVTAMVDIVQKVATGTLPKSSAEQMLTTSFPIDLKRAKAILSSVKEGSVDPLAVKSLSHSDRRAKADAFDEMLIPFDKKIAKGYARVMKDQILAQRSRLRDIAKGKKDNPVPIVEWSHLYRERNIYGEPEGDAEWTTVRTISEAELDRLFIGNEEKWGRELWGAMEGGMKEAINRAAEDMAAELGTTAFPTATDPAIVDMLKAKKILIVEGAETTLAEQIKRAILRGMTDADDSLPLATRVAEALQDLESEMRVMLDRVGTRAEMIARTETTSVANAARVRQMEEADVEKHDWLSAGDDLVRTLPVNHRIDGQVRNVGKEFSNGLRWPGDSERATSAGAVVNCRCTTLAVIEE